MTYHPPATHPMKQWASSMVENARLRGERDDPRGLGGCVRDAADRLKSRGLKVTVEMLIVATGLPRSMVTRHWNFGVNK